MFRLRNFNLTVTKIILNHSSDWRINEKSDECGGFVALQRIANEEYTNGPGMQWNGPAVLRTASPLSGYEQEYMRRLTWLTTKTY